MMQMLPGLDKMSILLGQSRYPELEQLARQFISTHPEIGEYKYYLSHALQLQGRLDEADEVADALLNSDPSRVEFIELKARIDIDQERLVEAERKLKGLLQSELILPEYYVLLGQIKFRQNNYDKSLYYLDLALEQDAENLDALNMRTAVAGLIGDEKALDNVEEALAMDPNNAYAIANHGSHLLHQGKEKEALERFKEALAIEPENALAQFGLLEAMKSRFWPYKMLHKYGMFMNKLSGKQSWTVIIGAYLLYRFVLGTARANPELKSILYPIAGLMVVMFISTWVLSPLMNLTLLTNSYGRLLLDEDEKKSAYISGMAFMLMLICLILWGVIGSKFMLPAGIFFLMLIPAGTFLSISGKHEKKAKIFGGSLIVLGFLAAIFILVWENHLFLFLYAIGLFIYQFAANAWMISTHGRVFD